MRQLIIEVTEEDHANYKAVCAQLRIPMRQPLIETIKKMTAQTITSEGVIIQKAEGKRRTGKK